MNGIAELEVNLRRKDAASYAVDLVFSQPDSDADVRPLDQHAVSVAFDRDRLLEVANDPHAYGQALSAMLFADPALATAVAQCRATAQGQGLALRLRLVIAPDAAELQALRWETLRNPLDGTPLALGEQTYFVRYLISGDWQPVRLRARSALRALIAVAGPAGLERYHLGPIDLAVERDLARAGMGSIDTHVIEAPARVTLDTIIARLREGYDIFYLVCHGGMTQGQSWLVLEDDQGGLARVSGADLAQRIGELAQRPRLALLVSCQSGGDGATAALNALAPRLAVAGVPAVLAMQGVISVATARSFVATFCSELIRDGCIDRAANVARGVVRERPDGWMPALYSRLRNGKIWYVPGFGDAGAGFEKWRTLVRSIQEGRCTPILGFGLLEPLIGSSREIARRWADTFGFPMTAGREDLPQVAQFVAVNQDDRFVRSELCKIVSCEIEHHLGGGAHSAQATSEAALDYLLHAAAAQRAAYDPFSSHRALAKLPFPLYITASPDSLLTTALKEGGRTPISSMCAWNDPIEPTKELPSGDLKAERPLVYHLFGQLDQPESLVLTEDDYFSYLINLSRDPDLVPNMVRGRLTETSLLFLGFRLDEWSFRVLFHSMVNKEVRNRRRRNTHVAVQIDLDEHQVASPDKARRYLESYFGDADINIYWGSAEDFLRELAERSAALS